MTTYMHVITSSYICWKYVLQPNEEFSQHKQNSLIPSVHWILKIHRHSWLQLHELDIRKHNFQASVYMFILSSAHSRGFVDHKEMCSYKFIINLELICNANREFCFCLTTFSLHNSAYQKLPLWLTKNTARKCLCNESISRQRMLQVILWTIQICCPLDGCAIHFQIQEC